MLSCALSRLNKLRGVKWYSYCEVWPSSAPRKNHSTAVVGSNEQGSRTALSSVATVSLVNRTSVFARLVDKPKGTLNFEWPAPFLAKQVYDPLSDAEKAFKTNRLVLFFGIFRPLWNQSYWRSPDPSAVQNKVMSSPSLTLAKPFLSSDMSRPDVNDCALILVVFSIPARHQETDLVNDLYKDTNQNVDRVQPEFSE